MPVYEYHCDKCEREVTLTLSIREHDKGPIKCPKCGSNKFGSTPRAILRYESLSFRIDTVAPTREG
jgi:putative FmdB family regulatory protein